MASPAFNFLNPDTSSGFPWGANQPTGYSSKNNQFDVPPLPTTPTMPTSMGLNNPSTPPGVVPPSSSMNPGSTSPLTLTGPQGASGMTGIGKGMFAQNPLDPALTSQLFQFLQSQIGQGVSPFDLSTLLPSSGQATGAGQLNAPFNQLLQDMMKNFGSGGQIGKMASQGIDVLPQWDNMVAAMQRQIGQGAANLKEQFNVGGGLVGSPYGTAATDYQTQSNLDLNSLLGNLNLQGLQTQLQAGQEVQGAGQFAQGVDQQAIQNMLQEFIRTSPQSNPLLGMEFGAATTFPPVLKPTSGMGGLGALLSGAGPAASGIAALIPALTALCWIAEVLYGKIDLRTSLVRSLLLGEFGKTPLGSKIVSWYMKNGEFVAEQAKKSPLLQAKLRPIFDGFLQEATSGKWGLNYARATAI